MLVNEHSPRASSPRCGASTQNSAIFSTASQQQQHLPRMEGNRIGRRIIDAEINGLIFWREPAHSVRLGRRLLMLDAASWARWIAGKLREKAARYEREEKIHSLAEVNHHVREIDRWLLTGKGLCRTTYVLYRRQLFAAPIVMAANCDLYVGRLLLLRAQAATVLSREFFFNADAKPPILYVLDDMSAAARYAGPCPRGRVVDRREMLQLMLHRLQVSVQHWKPVACSM